MEDFMAIAESQLKTQRRGASLPTPLHTYSLQPEMVTGGVNPVLPDARIPPVDEMITGQVSLP